MIRWLIDTLRASIWQAKNNLSYLSANSINGVLWAYGIEVIACCVILLAFFRMAGFIYSSADAWNSLFFCMFGAFLAIVCLADGRYMGQQLMLYNWIMIKNLRHRKVDPIAEAAVEEGGYERV